MRRWLATLLGPGLPIQSAVLGLAALVAYAIVAPVAGCISGVAGVAAAAAAAGVCVLSAVSAVAVRRVFRDSKQVMYGVLIGMLLRTGIPLSAALVLHVAVTALAEAHVLIYFLIFYPVTLLVETALCLPPKGKQRRGKHVFRNADL